MSVYIDGAALVNDAGRRVGSSSLVPRCLQLTGINYVQNEDGKWVPVADAKIQQLVASCRQRGGSIYAVGPPVTGLKPTLKISIGKRSGQKTKKKCIHNANRMCGACLNKAYGILRLSAAKAQGKSTELVDRVALRLPSIIGRFMLAGEPMTETRLRTASILAEDPVTLALQLMTTPMMRDAIALYTMDQEETLADFRSLCQVIYSLRHLMSKQQFSAFVSDGVAVVPYKMMLAFPKGAELAPRGSENRLSVFMVPKTPVAKLAPSEDVIVTLPAVWQCLELLKGEARKRLIISFVYNGTGESGMVRNLDEFSPDRFSAPPRVTIRVNDGPLVWRDIVLLLETYTTVIIEASYFNPAEVALFCIATILLHLEPGNVKTRGMPVVHEALRKSPRMAGALEKFAAAQKPIGDTNVFDRVREGGHLPEIVVSESGVTNLARVKRVFPLFRQLAAHLEYEVAPGLTPPLAPEACGRTTE
jgi:hypothetical protein